MDKGTLSISDITLPLKKEYVRALSAGESFLGTLWGGGSLKCPFYTYIAQFETFLDVLCPFFTAGGQGHHVVCLIRNAEHVIPTRLVSTFASPKDAPELKLRIPGSIKLENIYSDFTVTVEVYSLQAQEELLPHDVKYHINIKKVRSQHLRILANTFKPILLPSRAAVNTLQRRKMTPSLLCPLCSLLQGPKQCGAPVLPSWATLSSQYKESTENSGL